jgi:hypothetical protein
MNTAIPAYPRRQAGGGFGRFVFRLTCVGVCASVVFLSGCGARNFENINDELRAERMQLQREVNRLQQQLQLREDELRAARAQMDQSPAIEGAEAPRLSRITADRLSGAIDRNGDGSDDAVRLYLRTLDGRGRFMPTSGRAIVQIVAIRPGEAPRVLAEQTFDPATFDAAYRSGFTGTHYSLEVPLPDDLPSGRHEATARVTFTEGATGVEHDTQRPISITRR